jgi:hypothetical protein
LGQRQGRQRLRAERTADPAVLLQQEDPDQVGIQTAARKQAGEFDRTGFDCRTEP